MRTRNITLAPLDGSDSAKCVCITSSIPCPHTPRFLAECWSPSSVTKAEMAQNDLEQDWDGLGHQQRLELASIVLKGRLCLAHGDKKGTLCGTMLLRRYAEDEADEETGGKGVGKRRVGPGLKAAKVGTDAAVGRTSLIKTSHERRRHTLKRSPDMIAVSTTAPGSLIAKENRRNSVTFSPLLSPIGRLARLLDQMTLGGPCSPTNDDLDSDMMDVDEPWKS